MKRYVFIKIKHDQGRGTTIFCTDSKILSQILSELKKIIPGCATRMEIRDVTGVVLGFGLHQLSGKDREVSRWLIRLLCENGFEPFSVSDNDENYSEQSKEYHFRKVLE